MAITTIDTPKRSCVLSVEVKSTQQTFFTSVTEFLEMSVLKAVVTALTPEYNFLLVHDLIHHIVMSVI